MNDHQRSLMPKKPNFIPSEELNGKNYGINFEGKLKDVFVSPAIFSLIQTEGLEVFKKLTIITLAEDDEANPFKRRQSPSATKTAENLK